jgi:ankyrin repeat protein
LLLARADVHLTNLYGRTALHYAAMEGIVSACRALVDAGALSDELDHHGFIAVQHAVLMKRPNFLIEVIVKKPSEEEMLARRKRAKTT